MKLLRILDTITVVLNTGEIISSDNCTDALFNDIYQHQHDEDYVKGALLPEFYTKQQEAEIKQAIFLGVNSSKYLVAKGSSMYIPSISELSLPEDLISAIVKAENEENEYLLQTYLNFWTLVSLNPDSRCRQNLFWFLTKYGMTLSRSGLFVAYRNVNIKKEGSKINAALAQFISAEYTRIKFISKKAPSNFIVCRDIDSKFYLKKVGMNSDYAEIGNLGTLYQQLADEEVATIYTDAHSNSFQIKLGEIVTMARKACDSVQENTCSRGLHVAGKDWLSQNYFGHVGLMVLVNPADVVAVPPQDNYGKMRTCAYYPVSVVEFDENNKIKSMPIEDGFEDDFLEKICYLGEINTDDQNPYIVTIPDIPEIDKSKMNVRLVELAKGLKKTV